jgi:hypothetical protein
MESMKQHALSNVSIFALFLSISILVSSLMYLSYHLSNTNKGSVAIPAGKTYLGPPEVVPGWTDFSAPQPTKEPEPQQTIFTADAKTPWNIWKGKTFPYQFSYPDTLTLTGFPNDPMDSAGISWGGRKPQENILINVIDLSTNKTFEPYIKKSKQEFVSNWWKQFSGLTGVSPITDFTNKKGLKGYKARFINSAGQTPNLDVFFEVPKNPNLIIRIANGILDPTLFDAIVETVSWEKK